MFKLILLLFIVLSFSSFSQKVLDTLDIKEGTMVVYVNRTWEFIQDVNFDGVMNKRLHSEVVLNKEIGYSQSWDHDQCYTSGNSNDLNKLSDTIWMCLEGDNYPDRFVKPADGIITSHYGWRHGRNHNGTDIDLNTGDAVRAAWGGKVRYSQYNDGGFGNLVVIRHYNGLETFYAHLSKLLVVPNQLVEAGETIGLGGNTGHSYGSHLHFEVRFYDIPIDSEKIIDYTTQTVIDENLLVSTSLFRPGSSSSHSAIVASTSSTGGQYYRVRSGDTLGAIAGRNRTTVSKICQLNGIRPTTLLQVGKNLRVR
ncbi:MAG: M23 family metallopeptidase [Crocinitomicaceae bacterium]